MQHSIDIATAACLIAGTAILPAIAQPMPLPTVHNVVLVHSALVDGSSWRGVYDQLRKDGYNVSIVAHAQMVLSDDVAATVRVLDQQDGPAVLVGASYGGVVITQAGIHSKVSALVYVAAVQPDVGESLIDLSNRMPPASSNLQPDNHGLLSLDPKVFHSDFGADLREDDAAFLSIGQMPLSVAAASTKATVAAWHQKPAFGIVATEDRLINPELQRYMYNRGKNDITEIRASHAVFLSNPKEVARVIEKAALCAGALSIRSQYA